MEEMCLDVYRLVSGKVYATCYCQERLTCFKKRPEGTSIIIVIAPLTSLMEDQVESCTRRGIKAVAVTSEEESRKNYGDVVNGLYQIVYISPEMIIGTQKWRTTLQDDLYQSKLCAVVVDEAHCVKKW